MTDLCNAEHFGFKHCTALADEVVCNEPLCVNHAADVGECRECGEPTTDYNEDLKAWLHPKCVGAFMFSE